VTVVAGGTNYMYANGAYYETVMYGGEVTYRVVAAPAGAIITTLPGGCTTTVMGGVSVQQCGTTYYQRVSTGYQVVVF
jgi:Fe-S cluster biogenesis protein NfuA